MGALGFQFVSADAAHAWVHAYYNAFVKRQRKLADYKTNPNIALVSFFMCAKTDEEARARAEGDTFFQFALRFYGASANRERPRAGTVDVWQKFVEWKTANPEVVQQALRGGLVGSPDTIRKKLRKFQTSHAVTPMSSAIPIHRSIRSRRSRTGRESAASTAVIDILAPLPHVHPEPET